MLHVISFLLATSAIAGDPHAILPRAYQNLAGRPAVDQLMRENGGKAGPSASDIVDRDHECAADEMQFAQIRREALQPWIEGWRGKQANALEKVINDEFKMTDLRLKSAAAKKYGPVSLTTHSGLTVVERENSLAAARAYLAGFKKIDDFQLSVSLVSSRKTERFSDMSMHEASLSALYDLRGIGKDGRRRNDRASVIVSVKRESDRAPWKISEVRFGDIEVAENAKPTFTEITAASGVDKIPTYQRLEAIRRGGYALAMGDYDGDGNLDMYVGALGAGTLLKGDGAGHFKVAKNTGLGSDDRVKSAIFGDFDNDGRQDLMLVRFVGQIGAERNRVQKGEEVILYRNVGNGKFARMDNIHKSINTPFAMPATAADFNKDGLLDVYVGFPGVKDFTSTYRQGFPANEVAVEGLFLNKGKMTFEMQAVENPASRGIDQNLWAHSAMAVDFDQDGNTDIVVVDDRGNLSPAYHNDGNGKFTQVNRQLSLNNEGYGMGVSAGDFNNDGILDLIYSNVNTMAQERYVNSCRENWGGKLASPSADGLRLFQGLGGGKFKEVTEESGLAWAGEGLGGVEFVDYNNDGLVDIVVKNGLWSGTDELQDLAPFFTLTNAGMVDKKDLDETNYLTLSPVMNLLSHYQGDVWTGADTKARPQMAGRQHNRLFRNIGHGKFVEVGYLENMDSLADGYIAARADLNHDGKIDLVLRNGDPGSVDVHYPPVQVYLNNNSEKNNALRLDLKGKVSNRDGVGAEVKAFYAGQWHEQQVLGNNGTAQSEKTIHFGLGKLKKVDLLTIRWPSGAKDEVRNLSAGSYEWEENARGPIGLEHPKAKSVAKVGLAK